MWKAIKKLGIWFIVGNGQKVRFGRIDGGDVPLCRSFPLHLPSHA